MGKVRGVRKNKSVSTIVEDDGTQVEREHPKRTAAMRTKSSTVSVTRDANKNQAGYKTALKEFCLNTVKIGVQGLLEEFNTIRAQTQSIGTKPRTAFDANTDKNRYKDVYCIDKERVVLTYQGGNDYIHANWVNGTETAKKFICTQGPTEKTVDDFWRMVWQEKCKSIIMLCNVSECGKKKCEQYWPESGAAPMVLPSKLQIRFVRTEEIEKHLTLTKIEVTEEGKPTPRHMVDHIQWKDWPDRGVPEASLTAFRLLLRIKNSPPIVVHCSAGIGRTGTIVGLDLMHTQLEKGENNTLEKVVRELRDVRHGSVQTDVQYVYMHRILIAVAENKKAVTNAEVKQFIDDYDEMIKAKGEKN